MKSTAKLCKTIKKRQQAHKEMWEWRFVSLSLILLTISLITFDAVPGLIGTGIITIILIKDENVRRRF